MHFVNHDASPGIKRGGTLNIVRHTVELYCPAEKIPENITADLTGLEIAHSLHISKVQLPEGVRPVIRERDFTIATVVSSSGYLEERRQPRRPRPKRMQQRQPPRQKPGRSPKARRARLPPKVRHPPKAQLPAPAAEARRGGKKESRGGARRPRGRGDRPMLLFAGLGNPGPSTAATGTMSASWLPTRSSRAPLLALAQTLSRPDRRRRNRGRKEFCF